MVEALSRRENIVGNLLEAAFSLAINGERVPGLLFLPTDPQGKLPLVLIQHPATSSKDDYFVTEPARAWAGLGWICGFLTLMLIAFVATRKPKAKAG